MSWNERRVWTGHLLNEIDRFEHPFNGSAISLVGKGIAEVSVEVLDINRVCIAEAHDCIAGSVRGHHWDEVNRLAVHVYRYCGSARRAVAVSHYRKTGRVGRIGVAT